MRAEQRRADPVAVSAVAQLTVELIDEVAAMGQDQDAAGPGPLDEPECGDGLARAGGMLEPEPLVGVRVLWRFGRDVLVDTAVVAPVLRLLVVVLPVLEVLVLLARDRRGGEQRWFGGDWRSTIARAAVAVPLCLGEQRGQGAGERIDLVGREDCPVGQVRLLFGEQTLEPE